MGSIPLAQVAAIVLHESNKHSFFFLRASDARKDSETEGGEGIRIDRDYWTCVDRYVAARFPLAAFEQTRIRGEGRR
jgi:hypothetical protein